MQVPTASSSVYPRIKPSGAAISFSPMPGLVVPNLFEPMGTLGILTQGSKCTHKMVSAGRRTNHKMPARDRDTPSQETQTQGTGAVFLRNALGKSERI